MCDLYRIQHRVGEILNNNDEPVKMFATPEQVQLALKVEAAVEREIKNILEHLDCNFDNDPSMEVIERQLERLDIKIKKFEFEVNPQENGWYIYKHKKLLIIISEPWIDDKGRIKIRRRVPE